MVRVTRMTEEQMWGKVRRAATSTDKNHTKIDQAGWERVRRSAANKTGWNQGQVDAWAAKEIEKGALVINKVSSGQRHRLMSGVGRREARVAGLEGSQAERERAMQRVRRRVEERAREGVVTAAMLKDMKKKLWVRQKGKGGAKEPTQAVQAAILILVEEEGWEIQSREKGGWTWVEEALSWAKGEGWITGNKEKAVRAAAKRRVHLREGPELTVLY